MRPEWPTSAWRISCSLNQNGLAVFYQQLSISSNSAKKERYSCASFETNPLLLWMNGRNWRSKRLNWNRELQRLSERSFRYLFLRNRHWWGKREQRANDEPRCQALRDQNAQLTSDLIAMKGAQATFVSEFNAIKKNKSALSQQKVSLLHFYSLCSNWIRRNHSSKTSNWSQTQLRLFVHG